MSGADQVAEAPTRFGALEIFDMADAARDRGDFQLAASAYRALTRDPDLEVRTEARFRLAKFYADRMNRPRDAAILLRRILDDKPNAVAVRIELARVQGVMGRFAAAERELRAVRSSDLPPQVEQLVRFYAAALASGKPSGGSIEVAVAPSTNINRATSRTTLETSIGDFTLNQDARERSGIGLSLRGQAYRRFSINRGTRLLARISGDADLYRQRDFSDILIGAQLGPEWAVGQDRLALSTTVSHRWYGFKPYLLNYGAAGSWRHPLSGRAQVRLDAAGTREDNRANPLQTGSRLGVSSTLDIALSPREGAGFSLFANRLAARDPGYSTWSGGAGLYAYREFGRLTAVVETSYSRLRADDRLLLFRSRRQDQRLAASFSATLRNLRILSFAPLLRARMERNFSSIDIFDFRRVAGEIGFATAF